MPRPPARPRLRTIETILLASTACLLASTAWPQLRASFQPPPTGAKMDVASPSAALAPHPAAWTPKIQIALLIDTSSSMDGLIDQAREQLWMVVNALDGAQWGDQRPQLEIAVLEYGNSSLDPDTGYVRRVVSLSSDLDRVSEALFELQTGGGDEYAGVAIEQAVTALEWQPGPGAMRMIYIAGNESFEQGPLPYAHAIAGARERGISVNTINCVGLGEVDEGWAEAAQLGNGGAFRIEQGQRAQVWDAPQDDEIATLGSALGDTYLPYGAGGDEGQRNLVAQDGNAVGYGHTATIERALSKSSGYYRNPHWDLVDALEDGHVELQTLDGDSLPPALRGLSEAEATAVIEKKSKRRQEINRRLRELRTEREAFIAAQQSTDPTAQLLSRAIVSGLETHAGSAGFTL